MPPPPWLLVDGAPTGDELWHFGKAGQTVGLVAIATSGLFAGMLVPPATELLAEDQLLSDGTSANLVMLLLQGFGISTTLGVSYLAAPAMHVALLTVSATCCLIVLPIRENYQRRDRDRDGSMSRRVEVEEARREAEREVEREAEQAADRRAGTATLVAGDCSHPPSATDRRDTQSVSRRGAVSFRDDCGGDDSPACQEQAGQPLVAGHVEEAEERRNSEGGEVDAAHTEYHDQGGDRDRAACTPLTNAAQPQPVASSGSGQLEGGKTPTGKTSGPSTPAPTSLMTPGSWASVDLGSGGAQLAAGAAGCRSLSTTPAPAQLDSGRSSLDAMLGGEEQESEDDAGEDEADRKHEPNE